MSSPNDEKPWIDEEGRDLSSFIQPEHKPICRACECEIDEDGTCGCNPADA